MRLQKLCLYCLLSMLLIPSLTQAYSVYIYNQSKSRFLYYAMDGLTGYIRPKQMIQFINKSNIILSYQWYLNHENECNQRNKHTHFCFQPHHTVYIGCQYQGHCQYIKRVTPIWS